MLSRQSSDYTFDKWETGKHYPGDPPCQLAEPDALLLIVAASTIVHCFNGARLDMTGRNGIPEHSAVLIPRLICRDVSGAISFYVQVFGATSVNERPGPDGKVAHALLTIGPAMIMVVAEWPSLSGRAPAMDGSSPVGLFLYVEDVDHTVERAVSKGAKILVPLQNQFWGDRTASIMDPSGHVWTVASRIEDTTAEERTKRWSEILEKGQT
jgi:PhnB protein